MIKVKDGYAKLIGTTYQGSATQVLLSNGGNLEFSSATKANTLVQRNASQHIYATYFNSEISDEALTDIGSVYVRNTSDTFIRRISKTQFYSIIDNKFVTLDTAQTITGVKTFAASFFLDKSASLIQNQEDSSNYTTAIRWYKGGTSQGTYNPSIGQHNTGGDGKGSICILPYPTETSPWGGTVGLFISKGVLKLDGKSVALAENYYTKTESDERYVNVTGDTMTGPLIVKATVTGTQLISTIATGTSPLKVTSTTVVTNLNSDLFDGFHETAFVRSFWTSSPGYDCSKYNSRPLISFTYSNNAPFIGGFIDVVTNGYGFYLGTSYTSNAPLYYKRHGISSDGGMGTWQQLARITDNVASATKLQTARTINGTLFDGTANITTAYWGTARTITLSGAVTGSASVNGSQNVTITTTYQTGSIDGRYVGGNKTANHGSSGTAYTADSYSSTFARKEFVAFAERGSWAYANNGYVTTDTGVNIPLAGTAVFQWGASDTNKTQLFITPHNNSGVSNPAANEMLFYTSNGSGYTSAWTRVLTHRNYTAYTVTKTGGGASGTWGISITGSAPWANITGKPGLLTLAGITSLTNKDLNYATYNFGGTNKGDDPAQLNVPANYGMYLSLAASNINQGGQIFFNTVPGTTGTLYFRTRNAGNGNTVDTWKPWKTVLDSSNYTAYFNPANYVTALGTNGNYVTWTKNGSTNNITVPYATTSAYLTNGFSAAFVNKWDCNAPDRVVYSDYGSSGRSVTNAPSGWNYGTLLELGHMNYRGLNGTLNIQLMWDVAHNTTSPGTLWFRGKDSVKGWAKSWAKVITDQNISSILSNYYWANIKISASSSTATQPTFNTCYTSNWFRSSGATGWFNQSYSGGVYMNENYWVKTYGGTMMYIAPDAHAWGIGGHNIAMKLYHSSHIGINFATSAYTWGIYANSNGNMYIGRRTGNVDDGSGTYYHTLTASYISSPGFYHSAIGSNSYVLLAGGSYKGLGDFAKGNAGSATKGVYVTGGTVTAMTYSLNANLNSGTAGKLAYYSSATTVASYGSTVGASNRGIYMNAGVPMAVTHYLNSTVNSGTSGKLAYYSNATTIASYGSTIGNTARPVYINAGVPVMSQYSFTGTYSNPVVIWCGEIYRSSASSQYWYITKIGGCCSASLYDNYANDGNLVVSLSDGTPYAAICNTIRFWDGGTARSAGDGTIGGQSAGMGDYMTICTSDRKIYIRKFSQQNKNNDSWTNGELGTTTTSDGNKPVARFSLVVIGVHN